MLHGFLGSLDIDSVPRFELHRAVQAFCAELLGTAVFVFFSTG